MQTQSIHNTARVLRVTTLILTVLLSLTACGKGSQSPRQTGKGDSDTQSPAHATQGDGSSASLCGGVACPAPNLCENNVCVAPEGHSEMCGGSRCNAPNRCVNDVCEAPFVLCNNEKCATPNVCKNNACVEPGSPCTQIECDPLEICYVQNDHGLCKPNCDVTCNGKCASKPNQECFNGAWVDPCPNNRVRCEANQPGGICCEEGSVCISGSCVSLGTSCNPAQEEYCKITEYCDPTYQKCAKYKDNPSLCLYYPKDVDQVEVKMVWDDQKVYAMPLVVNLDDDNNDGVVDEKDIPEIVALTCPTCFRGPIHVLKSIPNSSGKGEVVWNTKGHQEQVYTDIAPAAADLTGNGIPEIVAIRNDYGRRQNGLLAYRADGTLYFNKDYDGNYYADAGGITIGDIDGDGHPEIVALGRVWSHTGETLFDIPFEHSKLNTTDEMPNLPRNLVTHVPVLADMNLDGYLDLVEGRMVFLYKPEASTFTLEQVTLNDSTTDKAERPYTNPELGVLSAVANFEGNMSSHPEIVTVHDTTVYLSDWRGNIISQIEAPLIDGYQWAKAAVPTIADFDGDELPEIGVAFDRGFALYDADIDSVSGKPVLSLRWYFKNTKATAKKAGKEITGSSVFDFDGDGVAEVVYNDEDNLYILKGGEINNGNELKDAFYKRQNGNITLVGASIFPVIADVDNDGHADIVAVSSTKPQGLRVFTNPGNNWVPTRTIWNQHAYNVTNINTNATVPKKEVKNWTKPWLNNFRQNVQEGNPFLAPNLVVEAEPLFGNGCNTSSDQLNIAFRMKNSGARGVRKNSVKAKVVAIVDSTEETIFEVENTKELLPGTFEAFKTTVPIKNEWAGKKLDIKYIVDSDQKHNECDEDDNTLLLENVAVSGAPDLSVDVSPLDLSSCAIGSNSKVTLSVKIKNNAGTSIPAQAAKVNIYAKTYGDEVLIKEISNTKELTAGEEEAITVEWTNVPADFQYKSIKIRAVVDEKNEIQECSEVNNDSTLEISCFSLG